MCCLTWGNVPALFGVYFSAANKGAWTEEQLKTNGSCAEAPGGTGSGSGPATIRKDKLYNNIPWTDVCQTVETRHWSQCRIKWWAGSFRGSCYKIEPFSLIQNFCLTFKAVSLIQLFQVGCFEAQNGIWTTSIQWRHKFLTGQSGFDQSVSVFISIQSMRWRICFLLLCFKIY